MRRFLHPTARKGREMKWEMMRLWGEESRKLKAGGRRKVKYCQTGLCCSNVFRTPEEKRCVARDFRRGTTFICGTLLKVKLKKFNHHTYFLLNWTSFFQNLMTLYFVKLLNAQ